MFDQTSSVLEYWFDRLDDRTTITLDHPQAQKWHSKDPEIDAEIRRDFLESYLQLFDRPSPTSRDAHETVANIIVLDQFPRNMFRDTADMFKSDTKALLLCKHAIELGLDQSLTLIRRLFLYMPLMHSENLEDQKASVDLFERLAQISVSQSPSNTPFFEMALGYARQHHAIIEMFGRFPHRNAILGRISSEAELAFLEKSGSSF